MRSNKGRELRVRKTKKSKKIVLMRTNFLDLKTAKKKTMVIRQAISTNLDL
jgi:hypothetical protein